jgi:quinol monooxygenase YgiN
MSTTKALLVQLEARHGKADEVEAFLKSALPLAMQESTTPAWFAIQFGRHDFGIFDAFADDAGRDAHLSGPIAKALMGRADELLDKPPRIRKLDVLADKLPATSPGTVTKAVLLTIKPKQGNEAKVADFLKGALPLVMKEEKTLAWFALRMDDGDYGIFDVFPDNGGRFAHLTGQVPLELTKHAPSLLGGFPDMSLPEVLASKLGR